MMPRHSEATVDGRLAISRLSDKGDQVNFGWHQQMNHGIEQGSEN